MACVLIILRCKIKAMPLHLFGKLKYSLLNYPIRRKPHTTICRSNKVTDKGNRKVSGFEYLLFAETNCHLVRIESVHHTMTIVQRNNLWCTGLFMLRGRSTQFEDERCLKDKLKTVT